MSIPFRPDHTDADELNALLDAMRSGSRAPETSREESGELARTARQFRGLADRAASATPAPARTFDAIWEDMMSAHAITAPTPVATGPTDRLDDTTHRVHRVREMPRAGWLQSLVSAAILAILLAGMIAAAWNLRDGNGGGTSDPGEDIRLAAPGLDAGTPEATAESEVDFSSYIDPRECAAKPLSPTGREAAIATAPDPWEGGFGPVSQPDTDDARAAAGVAREFKACERYIVPESLMTGRRMAVPELSDEARIKTEARERDVSSYLTGIEPSDVFLFTDQTPTGGQSLNPFVFIPETAVQFPDGRIGIPAAFLIPRNDPTYRTAPPDALMTEFDVLKQESGTWLVDEQLRACIGSCTHYINGGAQPFFDLRVNPDLATPVVRSVATPSPQGMPVTDTEWTTWVTREDCPPQQSSIVQIVESNPDYTLTGPADPGNAVAAAQAARIHDACRLVATGTTLDHYGDIVLDIDESYSDRATRQQSAGKAIADLYPIENTDDYFVFTDETPADSGKANLVFEPRHAIALEDGRIIIPGTWLIWTGDPSFIQQAPENFITQAVVMQKLSGTWVLAGNLPICLGDCDDLWPEPSPFNAQYSPIRVLKASESTPAPSPEASSDEWWTWPTANECTTEDMPLGTPTLTDKDGVAWSWDESRYIPFSQPSAQDAEAVAHVARELEACKQGGGAVPPLQSSGYRRGDAMQDPNYPAEYWSLSREVSEAFPIDDPSVFVRTTTKKQPPATPNSLTRRTGLVRDPLPFVYIPNQAVQLPDGRIGIPASALLTEGQPATDARLEGIERGTYRTNLLIFTNEEGAWLYDGELNLCIGDCDWLWEQMVPTATPVTNIDWTAWITAQECVIEPKTASDVSIIKRYPEGYPVPSYGSPSAPSVADAQAAAAGLRALAACTLLDNPGVYGTDAYIWRYQSPNSPLSDERAQADFVNGNGRTVSRELADAEPADFYLLSDPPAEDTQSLPQVYLPDNAIAFPDGRIGIPPTYLYPADDEASLIIPDTLYAIMPVMSKEDGQWLQNDFVPICIGNCDGFINGDPWWPELTSTPAANAIAPPVASTDWTAQLSAGECRVQPMSDEEYAAIMREPMSVTEREYTVVGEPDRADAVAAASVVREHEACAVNDETMQKRALESPYYVLVTNGGTVVDETPQERRMHEIEHGEEISSQFPDQDPMRYIERMDGDDMPAGFAGFVYRPDDAVQLSDGRIAIPATKLFGTLREDPDLTTFVMIVTHESGEWRVDESLSLCVGDCEAYWSEVRAYQDIPASPVASPVTTPEG